MKKFMVLSFAILMVMHIAGLAGAAPVYVYDGGLGTWSDVNKTSVNGNPDSFLCWAAAASDVLAWTGWRGWDSGTSTYIATATSIYTVFDAGWSNRTGAPTYAYEWWMTDRTQSNIPGYLFDSQGKNFYPGVSVQAGAGGVTAFVKDTDSGDIYSFLGTYINADRGIVASINVPSGPGISGAYSHSLTVWGWDPAAQQIYITDSDDGMTALRTYSFYQLSGQVYIDDYSNLYTNAADVQITQLTRLNRNDTGIEPAKGGTPPPVSTPEPGTLLLLGSGLIGFIGFRKRIS